MQRYEKLILAQVSEPAPSTLPLAAQILLLVKHINDGHLISTTAAPPERRTTSRRKDGMLPLRSHCREVLDPLPTGDLLVNAVSFRNCECTQDPPSVGDALLRDPRSSSAFATWHAFGLMQSNSVNGYSLFDDFAASQSKTPLSGIPAPSRPVLVFVNQNLGLSRTTDEVVRKDDVTRAVEPFAPSTGMPSEVERRATSLAISYAAHHANPGRERSLLQSTLCDFSRALLGLDSEETTERLDETFAGDEAAEQRLSARRTVDSLTSRQREVMVLVLAGRPNKLIAQDLCINQRTVENHRAAVMARTGSRSLPALARIGLLAGIDSERASSGRPEAKANTHIDRRAVRDLR